MSDLVFMQKMAKDVTTMVTITSTWRMQTYKLNKISKMFVVMSRTEESTL